MATAPLEKRGEARQHATHSERNVAVDTNVPARRCGRRSVPLGLVDVAENGDRSVVEGLAFRRQLQSARRAIDQASAQPRLQSRHKLADRRGRQAEVSRRRAEAAKIGDPDERLHFRCAIDRDARHREMISQMVGIVAS